MNRKFQPTARKSTTCIPDWLKRRNASSEPKVANEKVAKPKVAKSKVVKAKVGKLKIAQPKKSSLDSDQPHQSNRDPLDDGKTMPENNQKPADN